MDKYIDARFERVERALSSLVDSIAKYNPSATPAIELATADKELSIGLEELQTHQNNHLRIQSLKAASTSLDTQIRETLRTLWTTRKDITSTSTTIFPVDGPQYDINYNELLSYARRISKTTLPPPGLVAAFTPGGAATTTTTTEPGTGDATNTPGPAADDGGRTSNTTTAAPTPMPVSTPVVMTNGAPTPTAAGAAPPPPGAEQQNPQQSMVTNPTNLPGNIADFLDPIHGVVFIPWPAEDKVRSGALASIQMMLEQNQNPLNYDPAEEALRLEREEAARKAEQAAKEAEERERQVRQRQEAERIRRERQAALEKAQQEAARQGGAAGDSGAAAPQPAASSARFEFLNELDDD